MSIIIFTISHCILLHIQLTIMHQLHSINAYNYSELFRNLEATACKAHPVDLIKSQIGSEQCCNEEYDRCGFPD